MLIATVHCGHPNQDSIDLSGEWKRKEANLTTVDPMVDSSSWESVHVPGSVVKGLPEKFGILWVKHDFTVPAEILRNENALYMGRVAIAEEVYINGVYIGTGGRWPPKGIVNTSDFFSGWNTPRLYHIPGSLLREGKNEIAVRLYYNNEGWINDAVMIGPVQDLAVLHARTSFLLNDLNRILAFILIAVAVYHTLLFVRRRQDLENIFFAFLCVVWAIQSMNFALPPSLPVDYLSKERVVMGIGPFIPLSFALFFRFFFHLNSKFHKIATWALVLFFVPAFFFIVFSFNLQSIRWKYNLVMPVGGVVILYITVCIVQAWRAGDRNARLISASFLIIVAMTVNDLVIILSSTRGAIFLMGYAFPTLLFSIALVLANDFVRTRNQVEELNESLEAKVLERTRELQTSHDKIQELKNQQDGDYFLTSLLTKPLNGNFVSGGPLSLEIFSRAKKQFHFRKWDSEIGGDLCAAHRIELNGRQYVCFLNGDAMGKSMQGAGGALVLGTVFKMIITRTQENVSSLNRYPELWLKECLAELQNVFISFDGSMLVSCMLGLLDEENGFVYYILAEHPAPVIYRHSRAEFPVAVEQIRKIGTQGVEGNLRINTLQLEPGDILVVGSDGRDDLEKILPGGERAINEDETLFLRIVEKARADLPTIVEEIYKNGTVIDDLSLMRMGYLEDAAAPTENAMDVIRELKTALAKAREEKDYVRAQEIARNICERFPSDTDALFLASGLIKQAYSSKPEMLAVARSFGERCKLRDPLHLRNLINLADIYRLMGDSAKAQETWKRAETLDPDHATVQKLKTLLGAGRSG
ncbi:MAG TPA: SpoIIE family protein phosphatase [Leptospiraceae bacterium]|nr:SpoIIE family protein phosphatase [Leptospiraceae bacterium]HNL69645.1 SpoIIE family protein phosphatase [Leptospiraceae bacterium]